MGSSGNSNIKRLHTTKDFGGEGLGRGSSGSLGEKLAICGGI